MVGRWDKLASEGVHLCQWTYLACVAEVISVLSTSETWAGCWLYRDNPILILATKHLSYEWGDKSAEV